MKNYKFKVKNRVIETDERMVTGREVCELAGLIPPENYRLDMKIHGNVWKEIRLEDKVDLAEPGIEKFDYVSRDQTEG